MKNVGTESSIRKLAFSILLSMTVAMLFFPLLAFGVKTSNWSVDSFAAFTQGKPDQVIVSSKGEIKQGWYAEETAVEADGVWDMLLAPDGDLWIATGNKAKLLRMSAGNITLEHDADGLAITSLARDGKGNIYFAVLPGGKVYRRSAKGEVEVFADLPAKYVWTLLAIPGGELLAGTGEKGQVYRIDAGGNTSMIADTGDDHVLCLVRARDGTIYGGTASKGMLFSIASGDKYKVVYDFEEEEVRRVAIVPGSSGAVQLIAGVNSQTLRFAKEAARAQVKEEKEEGDEEGEDEGDDEGGDEQKQQEQAAIAKTKAIGPVAGGQGRVNGIVYLVTETGGSRALMPIKGSAITDMMVTDKREIYVATDQGGNVYRGRVDSAEYEILFHFKSSQVLSLERDRDELKYIGLGTSARIEKIASHTANEAVYTSQAFDAQFPASFGKMSWRASDPILIETRSGNVPDPDKGWSDWKTAAELKNQAEVLSPPARYFQFRVKWPPLSKAVVYSLTVPYTISNQAHYVDVVEIISPVDKTKKDNGRGANPQAARQVQKPPGPRSPAAKSTTKRLIQWQVTNPDGDDLIFRLYFQPEGADEWIPIHTPDDVVKPAYEWDTESIADGWYRIKVEASDERANQPGAARIAEKISEPFLIDNRKPEVKDLEVSAGGHVTGKVEDSMSAIVNLEYSVDGGTWMFILPADGELDEKTEHIKFNLPGPYSAGLHMLSVRGQDEAGNVGVGQTQFTWKP